MYPTLPFGPLSLPTTPLVALVAVTFGLEIAGRYGRRLGLLADEVWNSGLVALLGGLFVARLWNVIQFWSIYAREPLLILSIRPSGFAFWPGVGAAMVIGYVYLMRRALAPLLIGAAFVVGGVAAGIVLSIGAFLTGATLGTPSQGPWALPYFDELRHPAALYQAVGLWLLFILLWRRTNSLRPGRTIALALWGYALIRLVTDAFVDGGADVRGFRVSQIIALVVAVLLTLTLARDKGNVVAPNQPMNKEQTS
jgi:phosphatidylglycerol:prolipoprotein diacylglycerol transferase